MDKETCKRKSKATRKSIHMSLRVTPRASAWLTENQYSPQGIFDEGMRQLGYKE